MQELLIALAALAAQPAAAAPEPAAGADQAQAGDRQTLESLNRLWLDSYVTRDPRFLDSILADDFLAVYGGGSRRTKAELLERVRNPTAETLSATAENVQVQISGEVAVLTARSVLRVRNADGETEYRNDYADIYVRRDGRWRAISAHIVRVAPATR